MRSRTPLPQRQQAHWGAFLEAAALISQSGLCFEDAIAVLQKLAAGQSVTG